MNNMSIIRSETDFVVSRKQWDRILCNDKNKNDRNLFRGNGYTTNEVLIENNLSNNQKKNNIMLFHTNKSLTKWSISCLMVLHGVIPRRVCREPSSVAGFGDVPPVGPLGQLHGALGSNNLSRRPGCTILLLLATAEMLLEWTRKKIQNCLKNNVL